VPSLLGVPVPLHTSGDTPHLSLQPGQPARLPAPHPVCLPRGGTAAELPAPPVPATASAIAEEDSRRNPKSFFQEKKWPI